MKQYILYRYKNNSYRLYISKVVENDGILGYEFF